jgi:hypothetical protein
LKKIAGTEENTEDEKSRKNGTQYVRRCRLFS